MRTAQILLTAATSVALAAATLSAPLTTATASAAEAPALRGHHPFKVSIKTSTTELVRGHKVTLSGKVSRGAVGKKVRLQQKIDDHKWKSTGSATVNKKRRYHVSDKPKSMNARKYRVIMPATKKHRKGVSKSVDVGVYQWHDLYNIQARKTDSFYRTRTLSIDTVKFPKSYQGRYYNAEKPTGLVDFNLERNCIELKSTYGMSDDADVDSSVKIDVLGDGAELYTGTFALLESQAITLDLHGVFRLGFEYTALTDATAAPALGSPRVLCSF